MPINDPPFPFNNIALCPLCGNYILSGSHSCVVPTTPIPSITTGGTIFIGYNQRVCRRCDQAETAHAKLPDGTAVCNVPYLTFDPK